ncbi:MAG: Hpt domain-containing protein, partial [Gemmataceae bacterium]
MIGIDPSLFELFREEVRSHAATLTRGLLDLEADPTNPARIEPLMRAAHSIKGACRIVNVNAGVRLAHVMEDALVTAQHGRVRLTPADVDHLLRGTDLLATLAALTSDATAAWEAEHAAGVDALEPVFAGLARGAHTPPAPVPAEMPPSSAEPPHTPETRPTGPHPGVPPPPPFEPVPIPSNPRPLPAGHSMLDLFREELRSGLLIASDPEAAPDALKSIGGGARLVKCAPIARVAGALSAFLAAVRDGRATRTTEADGWQRYAVSTLAGALATDDDSFAGWVNGAEAALSDIAEVFEAAAAGAHPGAGTPVARPTPSPGVASPTAVAPVEQPIPSASPPSPATPTPPPPPADAVVRVSAGSLNRLMGLAGESLVQARWLPTFSADLLALRKEYDRLAQALDHSIGRFRVARERGQGGQVPCHEGRCGAPVGVVQPEREFLVDRQRLGLVALQQGTRLQQPGPVAARLQVRVTEHVAESLLRLGVTDSSEEVGPEQASGLGEPVLLRDGSGELGAQLGVQLEQASRLVEPLVVVGELARAREGGEVRQEALGGHVPDAHPQLVQLARDLQWVRGPQGREPIQAHRLLLGISEQRGQRHAPLPAALDSLARVLGAAELHQDAARREPSHEAALDGGRGLAAGRTGELV